MPEGSSTYPVKAVTSSASDTLKLDTIKISKLEADTIQGTENDVGVKADYEMEAMAYRIKPVINSDY